MGHQMDQGFRIRGGLENCTVLHQFFTQPQRIGQVAIMGNGQSAEFKIRKQGLDIAHHIAASGGVSIMTDSGKAL